MNPVYTVYYVYLYRKLYIQFKIFSYYIKAPFHGSLNSTYVVCTIHTIYSTSSKLLVTLDNARRLYLHANIKLCNCNVIITRKRKHLMSLFSSKPFLCFGVFSEILRTFWPKIQHHEEALSHP